MGIPNSTTVIQFGENGSLVNAVSEMGRSITEASMESTCELFSCDGDFMDVLRPGEVGRDGNSKILDAGAWGDSVTI